MRLHILVEGPSEEAFLNAWLPRFLPNQHSFKIITHQGKGRLSRDLDATPELDHRGLLDQLPAKLRAYEKLLNPDTDRVLVLVDADDEPCQQLKKRLIKALKHCAPRTVALIRIAVEETEAFYLGDRIALKRAFPRAKLHKLNAYQQDSVCGTWERFQDVIGTTFEDKPSWGEKMGAVLNTNWQSSNVSISFHHFCAGILFLVGERPSRSLVAQRAKSGTSKLTRRRPRK
jgi:hypothetical protein